MTSTIEHRIVAEYDQYDVAVQVASQVHETARGLERLGLWIPNRAAPVRSTHLISLKTTCQRRIFPNDRCLQRARLFVENQASTVFLAEALRVMAFDLERDTRGRVTVHRCLVRMHCWIRCDHLVERSSQAIKPSAEMNLCHRGIPWGVDI